MEKLQLFTASSLEKIFAESKAPAKMFDHFSVFKNEKASFQAAFYAAAGDTVTFQVASTLRSFMRFYLVTSVPGGFALPKNGSFAAACGHIVYGA